MARTRLPEFGELAEHELHGPTVRLLPRGFCQANGIVLLGRRGDQASDRLTLGCASPVSAELLETVSQRIGVEVVSTPINAYEVNKALALAWGGGEGGKHHRVDFELSLPEPGATAPQILDDILLRALELGASDIHIERYDDDVDVRLRIDGVLHQLRTHLSPGTVAEAVTRIKVLAKLDIAERRLPQDGRFRLELGEGSAARTLDFRVATLAGLHGEDVVLRVLDPNLGLLPLSRLGMDAATGSTFRHLLLNPEGTILVTGPTGSGKTTTLYSALMEVRDGTRKIITAEDPIEYHLDKISQKQVSGVLGMADLSRAFLRQDPDVMLIGEIRDEATAQTAAQAASTGHVVLGTLHTSDAVSAISRLRGLGLENDEIADTVLAVLAQRLVRRICPGCSADDPMSPEARERLGPLVDRVPSARLGQGCEACHGTGYRGRVGTFELMVVGESLQDAIAEGRPVVELRKTLHAAGMRTLVDDLLDKVEAGETSVTELLRVTPYRHLRMARG
jgi:type II secretory ATPase GspE/PulE/Tfp pilus assembly ATPase PilB-like protein